VTGPVSIKRYDKPPVKVGAKVYEPIVRESEPESTYSLRFHASS